MPDLRDIIGFLTGAGAPLPGRLNALPQPAKLAVGTLLPPLRMGGTLNQVGQAAGEVGKFTAGELALLAALGQVGAANAGLPGVDQGSPATQVSRQMLAQGPLHPGRALDIARHGPDTGTALLSGGLELAANPLNYTSPIGEAGRGLAVGAPAAGKAIQALALVGEAANRAQLAPLAALPGARRALLAAPEFTQPAKEAATAVAPGIRNALESAQAQAQARDLLAQVEGNVPPEALPLVGGKKQLGPIKPPEQFGYARGNVPGGQRLGPPLLPSQDVPLPPEVGPPFPGRGNVPADQLVPKIGRNGGKGVGPLLPPPRTIPALEDLTIPPGEAATLAPNPGAATPPATYQARAKTKFEQIMADLGPTDTPQEFRRKAEVARLLLGAEGGYLTGDTQAFALPFADGPIVPGGGVTLAEEAAAKAAAYGPLDHPVGIPQTTPPDLPGYQGQTRQQALAALDSDEIDNLLSVAYGHENGVANALLKRANPIDLADRAIERITTSRTKAGLLQQAFPDLAEKIAFLPDAEAALAAEPVQAAQRLGDDLAAGAKPPSINAQGYSIDEIVARHAPTDPAARAAWQAKYVGQSQAGTDILASADKVGGSDLTQADLNALSPQERMAALRKLAAEPAPIAAPVDDWRANAGPDANDLLTGIEDAVKRGNVDEANYLVTTAADYGVPVSRAQQVLNAAADAGGKGAGVDAQRQAIEQSPYAKVFQYFNRDGQLKRVNPQTGQRLTAKIHRTGDEIWNLPDSGYDEVAADALASPEFQHNQNYGQSSDDFWRNAQSAFRQYQALKKPSAEFGGDLAAGGGGFGLLPARLGSTLAGAAAGTGIGGLVGGGLGLATGHRGDQLQEDIGAGAALGGLAGGSVGSISPELGQLAQHLATTVGPHLPQIADTGLDLGFWGDAVKAGAAAQAKARGAKTARGLEIPGAASAQYRQQIVNTFKQIPQDALQRLVTNWGVAGKEFGTTGRDFGRWQGILRGERASGTSSLANPLTARLAALGRRDTLGQMAETYGIDYADSLTDQGQKQLGGLGRAIVGAGISATPSVRNVPIVAPLYGAARGYFAPFVNATIQFINGIQHDAFRYALAEKALDRDIPQVANDFLTRLAAQGVNVAPLQAAGGFFSPGEVAAVAGQQAAKEWDGLTTALIKAQGDRIAFLAGDFRKASETGAEKFVSKIVPFSRWALRNAPVLAEVAANHPRAAAVIAGLVGASAAQAKEQGLKAYQVGTIPISTETPVVGGLARLHLGGKQGTDRLNVLGAATPFSGDMLQPPDLGGDQTGYQKAKALLGVTGFSPSPLIQTAAYVTGQDYQGPGALSRTAGLEQLPGLLPGALGATMPSGAAALDTARGIVEPALQGAGIATAGPTTEFDPVMRRYDELIQAQTGHPLNAIENRQYLLAAGDPENPLWQQARRETVLGGAAQNVVSVTSPASVQGQTTEALATQRAKAGVPFSQARIVGSSPGVQQLMQAGNVQYQRDTPATQTYKIGNRQQAAYSLLDQFDADPENRWLALYAPQSYKMRRDELMIRLGLKAPPKAPRVNPYLTPGR